jgi:hypothetical protein
MFVSLYTGIRLEIKPEKSKYKFVCFETYTGIDHNINICNISLEMWKDFKYLVITLINKNCVHDNIEFD